MISFVISRISPSPPSIKTERISQRRMRNIVTIKLYHILWGLSSAIRSHNPALGSSPRSTTGKGHPPRMGDAALLRMPVFISHKRTAFACTVAVPASGFTRRCSLALCDRCHSLAFLSPPPAAVGSLPLLPGKPGARFEPSLNNRKRASPTDGGCPFLAEKERLELSRRV